MDPLCRGDRFVREMIFSALYGRTGGLVNLNELPGPMGAIREIAALGQLAEWPEDGGVRVSGRVAAEAAVSLAADANGLHELEGSRHADAGAGGDQR
jgi:hypothetical protein